MCVRNRDLFGNMYAGIGLVLAQENTELGFNGTHVPPPKIYSAYRRRSHNGMRGLWSKEKREKRNNWNDLLALPYPRYDPIQRRLVRWGVAHYFDLDSLSVNPENIVDGSIAVKAEYAGREDEILMHIYKEVTLFFYPLPTSYSKGSTDHTILDYADGKWPRLKDPSLVNWYQTIMNIADVRQLVNVTAEQIVDDWKCDKDTHTHPDDTNIPCDPACDLRDLLSIDFDSETAMLTDVSHLGPDGTKETAAWWILKECAASDTISKPFESQRHNVVNLYIGQDMAKSRHGLCWRLCLRARCVCLCACEWLVNLHVCMLVRVSEL